MRDIGVMDYSLLLGVEKVSRKISMVYDSFATNENLNRLTSLTNSFKFMSTCGSFIYNITIIDYLQRFNLSKKLEREFKKFTTNALPSEISSIDCDRY